MRPGRPGQSGGDRPATLQGAGRQSWASPAQRHRGARFEKWETVGARPRRSLASCSTSSVFPSSLETRSPITSIDLAPCALAVGDAEQAAFRQKPRVRRAGVLRRRAGPNHADKSYLSYRNYMSTGLVEFPASAFLWTTSGNDDMAKPAVRGVVQCCLSVAVMR